MNNNRYIRKLDASQTVRFPKDVLKKAGWHAEQRLYVWVDGEDVMLSPCNDVCRWCGQEDPARLLPIDPGRKALICDDCLLRATESKARRDELERNDAFIRQQLPHREEELNRIRKAFGR